MSFNPLKIFDPAKKREIPKRDASGRFMGKKILKEEKKEREKKLKQPEKRVEVGPILATFYGNEIRKYYKDGSWLFSVDDVISIGYPDNEPVKVSPNYKKIKERVVKSYQGIEVALAKDLIELIKEVKNNFPGPVDRWLTDSSNLPAPENP